MFSFLLLGSISAQSAVGVIGMGYIGASNEAMVGAVGLTLAVAISTAPTALILEGSEDLNRDELSNEILNALELGDIDMALGFAEVLGEQLEMDKYEVLEEHMQ